MRLHFEWNRRMAKCAQHLIGDVLLACVNANADRFLWLNGRNLSPAGSRSALQFAKYNYFSPNQIAHGNTSFQSKRSGCHQFDICLSNSINICNFQDLLRFIDSLRSCETSFMTTIQIGYVHTSPAKLVIDGCMLVVESRLMDFELCIQPYNAKKIIPPTTNLLDAIHLGASRVFEALLINWTNRWKLCTKTNHFDESGEKSSQMIKVESKDIAALFACSNRLNGITKRVVVCTAIAGSRSFSSFT